MASTPRPAPGTPRPAPSASSRLRPQRVVIKRQGTSYVALKVRNKLQDAAAAPEWDLRQLIGHANTLDHLAERLADPNRKKHHDAEEEQETIDAIAEKTEAATDAHTHTLHTEAADASKGEEEEEEVLHEDSSDSDLDAYSDSEGDWLSTEPSTALEHPDDGDYFGNLTLERTHSAREGDKSPSVVVVSTNTDDKTGGAQWAVEPISQAELSELTIR